MAQPTHHLPPEVLAAYRSRTAPESLALVAATHLALCSKCRARVGLPDPAALARRSALPEPLHSYAHDGAPSIPWRRVWRGVQQRSLPVAGARARLMRLRPGLEIPAHGHRGQELAVVLEGQAHDDHGTYRRGDVVVQPAGSRHHFAVATHSTCVVLIVNDGPMTSDHPLMQVGLRLDALLTRARHWLATPRVTPRGPQALQRAMAALPPRRPSTLSTPWTRRASTHEAEPSPPSGPDRSTRAADPSPPDPPRYSELLRRPLHDVEPPDPEVDPRRLDAIFGQICRELGIPEPSRPGSGSDQATARVIHGSWRLGKVLGRGGFGIVFEAQHIRVPQLRRAIKLLLPDRASDEQLRRRFHAEASVMATLRGRYLVEITDYGETEEGTPFVVMERLVGETLQQRLTRTGPLALPEFFGLGRQLVEGLTEIHQHGVVHRDLKPSNLFVTEPGPGLKLLDFGLAKTALTRTASDILMGTPAYMAPELLARSAPAGVHSDLYAMAAILYEMLTGQRPIAAGADILRFAVQVATQRPTPIRALRPEVPAHVADAIERGLAKDPACRPASARALWARVMDRPALASTTRILRS